MPNLVKYGEYSADTAASEQEALDAASSGGDFVAFKEGSTVIRVLPPRAGEKTPFYSVEQHYINVPGSAQSVRFACPRKMAKRPCKACNQAEKLRNNGNPVDADMAKEFWPRRRTFVNVIDRATPEKGPRIAALPKTVYEALINLRQDRAAGGNFSDPYEGFDIVVRRKGTGKFDTEYTVSAAREASPLAADEQQMADWIDAQHNLKVLVQVPTDEEINQMLSGGKPARGDRQLPERATEERKPRQKTIQDDLEDDK